MRQAGKQTLNAVLLALLALIMVMAAWLPGMSACAEDEAEHHVTFINAPPTSTALYVTKQVVSENSAYKAPEGAEFQFVLKLNGDFAKNKEYSLMDANGQKVYVYNDDGGGLSYTTEENTSKLQVALKTTRGGEFSLKAGWTAVFDGLSEGDTYEISEYAQEGYVQTSPVAGTGIAGTMAELGNAETFVNTYQVAVTPPPSDDGEDPVTDLRIDKQLSYPSGYELPETPGFTFRASVAGEALAGWEYEAYDASGNMVLKTAGEGGELTLKGGEYAIFRDVPLQADYRVEELTAEGWSVIGDAVQVGAMSYPMTRVRFSNSAASFGVSKKMGDTSAPEEPFTFILSGSDGSPMAGAQYYVYDKSKKLVDAGPHATAGDGSFGLMAGQTAIFIGVEAGTQYNVKEVQKDGYIQTQPASADGYSKTVSGDAVEVLPFTNKEDGSRIQVTKKVVNISDEMEVPDAEFTFVITKVGDDGKEEPVCFKEYTVSGQAASTQQTTEEPAVAKYAVQLYGICQDVNERGDTMGLTFGPALGANYIDSYEEHDEAASGATVYGHAARCIHKDTWEEIIYWNNLDPYVYESCIANGCTHSIELSVNGTSTILNTVDDFMSSDGDGPGALYDELVQTSENYENLRWDPNTIQPIYGYYSSDSLCYWSTSRVRAMLNGADGSTDTKESNITSDVNKSANVYTVSNCLLATFPEELRNAIGARKTKSGTDDGYTEITYDKLWLLSPAEIAESVSGAPFYNSNERLDSSSPYQKFNAVALYSYQGNDIVKSYATTEGTPTTAQWWLRSNYSDASSNYRHALCVSSSCYLSSAVTASSDYGISTAFALDTSFEESNVLSPTATAAPETDKSDIEDETATDSKGRFTLRANETALFTNLGDGTYKVEEVDVPEGFFCNTTNPMTFDATKSPQVTFINGYGEIGETSFKTTKRWVASSDDSAARPDTIQLHLYQNNALYETVEVGPDEEGNWEYEWTGLPARCGRTLQDAVYTVREEPIAGYQPVSTYSGSEIMNVRTIRIEGEKQWLVDNTKLIPSKVKVNLYQNGMLADSQEVSAATGWKYDFGEYMECNVEGTPYEYTVQEEAVPDGMSVEYIGLDIFNIQNTSVEGTKIWEGDDESARPESVTVTLYRNGEDTGMAMAVSETTGWKYSFKDLPMFEANGKRIEYSVKETVPDGYKAVYGKSAKPAGLRITFSSDSKTESSYDYLVVYYKGEDGTWYMAKNNSYVTSTSYCYYSTKLANAVIEVPAADFYLFFKSDSSVCYSSYMGFKVVSVEPIDALSGNTVGVTSSNFSTSNPETIMAGSTTAIYDSRTTNSVKAPYSSNLINTSSADDLHVYQSEYGNNMGRMFHYTYSGAAGDSITNRLPEEDEDCTISIRKADQDGAAVEGAKLELYEGDVVAEGAKPCHTWVSGKTPEAIPYMKAGTYVIHEAAAPDGYLAAEDVTITVADGLGAGAVQEFVMTDEKIISHISIAKVNINGGDVSGASMQLLDATKENVLHEWTSSASGPENIDGLEPGTYYIREVAAPAGYYVGKDMKVAVSVPSADADLTVDGSSNVQAFEYLDEYSKGGISIYKVDTYGRPLEDVRFQIYKDEALTKPLDAVTSKENGVLSFEGLDPGVYWLKEIKSGVGTSLLLNPIKVELTQTDSGITYKVNDTDVTSTDTSETAYVSTKRNGDIVINIKVTDGQIFTLPSSGGSGVMLAVAVIIGVAMLMFMAYYHKRRKEVLAG